MRTHKRATGGAYARLSGFYFFFFASLGAFTPFWPLYLKHLAFSPQEIGELFAVVMAMKVVAPNLWGWVADHSGRRVRAIRIASFLSMAAFSAVLWVGGYWWMLAALAAFSFFWNAALPQFEATTLNHLGTDAYRYSRIRLWGSVGFIVSVLALAPALERFGIALLPVAMLGLLAMLWLNTLTVGEATREATTAQPSLGETLAQPVVIALLASCFLLQASHGPYYTFFSIYLEDHGYAGGAVGVFWALGVVAEVAVFVRMHRWLTRFGARKLLLVAMAGAVLRWLLIATLVAYPPVLVVAQLLHAASFALYHGAAIQLIHRLFPGRLQGRGQALYASLSFGLGGAVGSLASGYVWSGLGPAWVYVMAAGLAAAGCALAWRGVRESRIDTQWAAASP